MLSKGIKARKLMNEKRKSDKDAIKKIKVQQLKQTHEHAHAREHTN